MYEIWNEPTEVEWKEIKDYAEEVIPVIRAKWIAWSVSDKEETCSMLYPTASSDGRNWTEADMKPWAKMVKASLKENRK